MRDAQRAEKKERNRKRLEKREAYLQTKVAAADRRASMARRAASSLAGARLKASEAALGEGLD